MSMDGKFISELSRVFGGALSNISSVKKEMEKFVHEQIQQFFQRMDMVSREEFEVQKELTQQLRAELDAVQARLLAQEEGAVARKAAS
jgi:BMFP domain-containing protein YqiC